MKAKCKKCGSEILEYTEGASFHVYFEQERKISDYDTLEKLFDYFDVGVDDIDDLDSAEHWINNVRCTNCKKLLNDDEWTIEYDSKNDLTLEDMIEKLDYDPLDKDEKYHSYLCRDLCDTYPTYFDVWWNPDKFDWENSSKYLCEYCSQHFDKWWDPDKFNYIQCSTKLIKYCSEYFNKWWDPDKIKLPLNGIDYLKKYCSEYKDIWKLKFEK